VKGFDDLHGGPYYPAISSVKMLTNLMSAILFKLALAFMETKP
jgi:hypothetical protein